MNLRLNPSQLLSLYELTISSLTSNMDVQTNLNLKEIKQKLHELIFESLNETYMHENKNKFSSWSQKENDKITTLKDDLQKVKMTPISQKENASSKTNIDDDYSTQKEI